MKKMIVIAMMVIITSSSDAKVMKRMSDVQAVLSRPAVAPAPIPVSVPKVDQDAITKRLDEQLRFPVESAWNDRINDLFDLAMVNRELARDYFIKMRSKMESAEVRPLDVEEKKPTESMLPAGVEPMKKGTKPAPKPAAPKAQVTEGPKAEVIESTLPAGEEPMKKSTGRPAPQRKPAVPKAEATEAPKVETPEIPSGEEMKKGTRPAPSRKPGAPSGGPKKALTPAKGEAAKPVASKETAPKVVEQIFSVSRLQQLDNDKLMELLNDLLEKLGTVPSNWNGMIVERVEEKTQYSSKIRNVYGAPVAKWTNDINTLKKVIISKNIMPEAEVTQKIADRIAQVRAEKNVKPAVSTQPEEKPKEELTEEDLVKLIKAQLADPKADQIGWVVSIKGNIKALDKLNHDAAMQYHDQFIKLTKERPFLK